MAGFLILLGLSLLFLIFLAAESISFTKKIKRISLRITVSGTRGKSSIVRTLASVFRAHGIKVLAKTTGSEAIYILPDGTLEPIKRRGLTTILEQKMLIAKAVKLEAECVITEIMSIHPDNHKVETHKLIRPGLTLFSNFRADHTDVVGESLREISELFVNDIFPGSRVIIPEEEVNEFLITGIRQLGATLIAAKPGLSDELNLPASIYEIQIKSNLDTVVATARYLGIPDDKIIRGIINTKLDIGQIGIFGIGNGSRPASDNRKIWFVNAFAANDPLSTRHLIEKAFETLKKGIAPEIKEEPKIIGLLSLRSDRGERSRQWLNYLQADGKDLFSQIYVSGIHSPIFTRKLKNCERLISKKPEQILNQIIQSTTGDIIIFGIANIHGLGEQLLAHLNLHPRHTELLIGISNF